MKQGDRCILWCSNRVVGRLFSHRTTSCGVDYLSGLNLLRQVVEQHQRSKGVVVMVGNWICNRRLIPVITTQMPNKIKCIGKPVEYPLVSY